MRYKFGLSIKITYNSQVVDYNSEILRHDCTTHIIFGLGLIALKIQFLNAFLGHVDLVVFQNDLVLVKD